MKVNEIFYSLQGEGARTGSPSVFIRLAGCTVSGACYASGIRCDTQFTGSREMSLGEILDSVSMIAGKCRWIIWTGGEPTDQLTADHVAFFNEYGFSQAIETSGIRPVPPGLQFVSVSPKVAEHVLAKNFPQGVDEIRYVLHQGQALPEPKIPARFLFISPHFDGDTPNQENIAWCIDQCLKSARFSLSLQIHKMLHVR